MTAAKSPRRGPAIRKSTRPRLRVLGTEITLLEPLREQAQRDLGVDISFEVLDFVDAQRKAAMQPESFDIYDQCFHNLDIVWHWRAIQPIDTQRIAQWGDVSELTKSGRLRAAASVGRGDAPVKKLYVQPGQALGRRPSRYISMLPTVYNMDSFVYDPGVFTGFDASQATWGWLFAEQARGRLALVDEPAIGPFDAALALEALGLMQFSDIGNMKVPEIDQMMAILNAHKREGFFCGLWKTAAESVDFMQSGRASIQSMWSPGTSAIRGRGIEVVEAVPREGYRAWHGGLCLSSCLSGPTLDVGYDYLNWWLSGWPGALMSRQGYYISVPSAVQQVLGKDEWGYWYEGHAALRDLPGTDGRIVVRAGQVRAGGSYAARTSHIAVWNTTMDEHNYLVRRWTEFASPGPLQDDELRPDIRSPRLAQRTRRTDRMTSPPARDAAPEKRYDLVERVVRVNIVSGRLRPGTVLLEGPIAELLQTSRAPVKKALQALEAERLIHVFDGRGYLVGPPHPGLEPQRVDLRQLGLEIPEDIEVALQSRGSWERIYVAVESAIASCLAFGEYRMIESDIATHFHVSRTVVRDVLSRLQERGLVRKSQTSRWIAGPLTAQSMRDRFELRKVLEPMALVGASADWDREQISQLRIRAEAARQQTGDTKFSGSDDIEAALQQITVLKAPNAQLVEFIQQNLLPLNAANRILTQLGLPSDRVAIDEHCMILDLILNDSIEPAAALLREHLTMAEHRSIARLKIVAVIPNPVSFAPYLIRV